METNELTCDEVLAQLDAYFRGEIWAHDASTVLNMVVKKMAQLEVDSETNKGG